MVALGDDGHTRARHAAAATPKPTRYFRDDNEPRAIRDDLRAAPVHHHRKLKSFSHGDLAHLSGRACLAT